MRAEAGSGINRVPELSGLAFDGDELCARRAAARLILRISEAAHGLGLESRRLAIGRDRHTRIDQLLDAHAGVEGLL